MPDHYYFFDRTSTTAANKWTVILDIDQSGSMGESVIYSSVMSCILASMSSLRTRVVAFDTNIVDLTEKCDDPVELLFGFQLGEVPILSSPWYTAKNMWRILPRPCFS